MSIGIDAKPGALAVQGYHHQLAQRMRSLRVARGWSQRQLAIRANLSPSTVSRLESGGRVEISVSTLTSLAVALGCSTDDLVDITSAAADAFGTYQATPPASNRIRHALIATTLDSAPQGPAEPLPATAQRVVSVRRHRRACDYRSAARQAAKAMESLHQHVHGPDGPLALSLLGLLCFDTSAVLIGLQDLGTAWIAADRCRAVASRSDRTMVAVAGLAVSQVALRQRVAHRAMDVARCGLDNVAVGTVSDLAVTVMLHLTVAGAGSHAGALSSPIVNHHLACAEQAAPHAERADDPLGLAVEPALVEQARFGIAVRLGRIGSAQRHLRTLRGRLTREPAYRSQFFLDLARFHLDQSDHHRALDCLLLAEQTAPQHAQSHPEAAEIIRRLSIVESDDATLRRVCGIWRRFQPHN
ncbi:helix-turn-helix domain-containing protein [Micromonospora sp. LOL_025]|uniref:helix-turn-helix domain-containing protein n=1 Tax=Micromonospora sp. LOL_025 TaxID=3345413 RepID=UPI003A8A2C0F